MTNNTDSNFDLVTSASHLLHRAQQLAANQSASALREAGITLRQFSVLSAISQEEGVSQSHLVQVTGIDRSTLADMAARMEAAKLIKRVASKTDARAKSLTLMAAGRKALQKAMPGVTEADTTLLSGLPASRRDAFLKALITLTTPDEKPVAKKAAAEPAKPTAPKAKTAAPAKKKKTEKKKKKKK